MKKKIQSKKGFTLVEMMACVLTLTILTGICSMGINLSLKCYQESVFESESQMLKSTLDLSINDILRYATNVNTETLAAGESKAKVTGFTNLEYQIMGGMIEVPIANDNSNKDKFVIYNLPSGASGRKEYLLIGHQVYGGSMYITDFNLEYEPATRCFYGTYTIKSTIVDTVNKTCTFACRAISE